MDGSSFSRDQVEDKHMVKHKCPCKRRPRMVRLYNGDDLLGKWVSGVKCGFRKEYGASEWMKES